MPFCASLGTGRLKEYPMRPVTSRDGPTMMPAAGMDHGLKNMGIPDGWKRFPPRPKVAASDLRTRCPGPISCPTDPWAKASDGNGPYQTENIN